MYIAHTVTVVYIGAHRGVPDELMRRNSLTVPIDPRLLPEPDDAVEQFESFGGNLTRFSPFGRDPLVGRPDLAARGKLSSMSATQTLDSFFIQSSMVTTLCFAMDFCTSLKLVRI